MLCLAGLLLPAAADAAFPGSNGDIAFSSADPNVGYFDVFAAAPDGSNLRNVTNSASRDDHDPVWSADGSQLAFWSIPYVATINADGSGQSELRWGGEPSFSPDGSRIAYSTTARFFPESNQEIFIMNRDGSDVRNLTNEPLGPEWGHDYAPAWSPDGTQVAFSRILGSATGIYAIGADGTGLTQLVSGPAAHPDWAPDGNAIVFDAFGDIYQVDATGLVQLTSSAADDKYPVFSPDGTKIAFQRATGSGYDVMIMNADGTGEHLGIANARAPDWQPLANRPPDCSGVRATPANLGAPNHRLITVTISGATDPDGDTVDLEITGVTQDEPPARPRRRGHHHAAEPGAAARRARPQGRRPRLPDRVRGKRRPRRHLHRVRDGERAQGQPARSTPRRRATTPSGRNLLPDSAGCHEVAARLGSAHDEESVAPFPVAGGLYRSGRRTRHSPGANGKITFTSRIDGPEPEIAGPPQVFTIDPDGTDLTQLTFSGLHDDPATFSPDGRRSRSHAITAQPACG